MSTKLSTITGKFVFERVSKDFKFFYAYNSNFTIKSEFGGSNISYKGSGEKARICLSKDLCDMEIKNLDDFYFVMIVICHELTHYLHKHNDITSNSHESRAIEDWADFFGMKILLTLTEYGLHTKHIYSEFAVGKKSADRIKCIANALGKLAKTLYKNSNSSGRYSNTLSRVGLSAAGINSFFDAYFNNFDVDRSWWILSTIYKHEEVVRLRNDYLQLKSPMPSHESINNIANIHQAIQGKNSSITTGLRSCFIKYIGTNYKTTPAERSLHLQKIKDSAKAQGLDIDLEIETIISIND